MTIYIGDTTADKSAIRAAASRGSLRRIARDVYTDDHESKPEKLIRENLLAILGKLLPDWHLSFSTAATLTPIDGHAFMSGFSHKYLPLNLPGVDVIRLPDLKNPEVEQIEAPTLIAPKLSAEPDVVRVNVSSPLQTVFECMASAKKYSQKLLPEHKIVELIGKLSAADRDRAVAFAMRNALKTEHWKYLQLCKDFSVGAGIEIARKNNFAVYFYGWEIGNLTALQSDEFKFEYSPDWKIPLSGELPIDKVYESRRMPAFFENLLPEGWTESQLQSSFKIAREDTVALLATTQKYLSNLTLRGNDFKEAELKFDTIDTPLSKITAEPQTVLKLRNDMAKGTTFHDIFRNFGKKGPMRISGVQAKLPVELTQEQGKEPKLELGTLPNSCSYILKYQSPLFPHLVEDEWATMELARRIGLPTAGVRQVEFRGKGLFPGRALLIERYDIPNRQQLETNDASTKLALQQDAASLLKLYRHDKYNTSAEKVADALLSAGLSPEQMNLYIKHLIFSGG